MSGWRYFLAGMICTAMFGLWFNKALAGEHTGEIYVGDEDVTWCIYRPEGDGNDGNIYAVRFEGKVECPETYDDEEVE